MLVTNDLPSTDKPIATVDAASPADVDRAVKAAKAALVHPSWKLLPATERGQLMARLADLMWENRELLATIDAWDNGALHCGMRHADPDPFFLRSPTAPLTLNRKAVPRRHGGGPRRGNHYHSLLQWLGR